MANDAECGYVVIGAVTSMEDIKARKEQTKTEAEHARVEWTEPPLRNFTNQALLTWFGYDSKFNLVLLFFVFQVAGSVRTQHVCPCIIRQKYVCLFRCGLKYLLSIIENAAVELNVFYRM